MQDDTINSYGRTRRRSWRRATAMGRGLIGGGTALLLLAGCNGLERHPSGAMSVTVKPGDTGTCAIAPCRVYFEVPPGDGDYRITGNSVGFGRYPAGRTVSLGDFYDPISIAVEGTDLPKAYVYIPVYR